MNTGGPASEKTLLDEFAGQALAAMVEAESKESHKQLTNDGYEHEATHFPRGFADEDYWDGAAKASYACASAMLAEKARREANHSGDANKMVPNSPKQHDACALLRKFVDEIEGSDCSGDLWSLRREAISLLDQAPDHSPDAGKMAEINRELAEALDAIVTITDRDHVWWHKARSALSKAKGVA